MIPYKQLSLADIFEDCQEIFDSDKPQFLSLLEKYINLDEIIPASFYRHYDSSTGRNRKYPLRLSFTLINRLLTLDIYAWSIYNNHNKHNHNKLQTAANGNVTLVGLEEMYQ